MQQQSNAPTILVLFGITSDLAHKMILPALYHLERHRKLPRFFRVVGVSRQDLSGTALSSVIVKSIKSYKKKPQALALRKLIQRFSAVQGDAADLATYDALAGHLRKLEGRKVCANRLWYFSTLPTLYKTIAHNLEHSGLLAECQKDGRKLRVLIEKPFGHDLKSAIALNSELHKYFNESHIYRIDHYVGKETVQNVIVARFANTLFEPLWNREYIDHVEISVLEPDGVGHRAEFYDATGALSDVVQNHMLQLLALIAMEEPKELSSAHVRNEKVKVLSSLKPFRPDDTQSLVRGQHTSYQQEVGHKSNTETFVALKAYVSNSRWQGVPFYLRTGKRLQRKVTEISIHFKELPKCLFRGCAGNVFTFRIQPNESVYLRINNKVPGFGVDLHQGNLEFSYYDNFKSELPGAYERLLLDFLQGDQRLFISSEEVEASWKFIDSARTVMNKSPLVKYKAGDTGPQDADIMIAKDGREWFTK